MTQLTGTIFRTVGRALFVLAVLALLLGRSAREPGGGPRTGPRSSASPRYHGISGSWFVRDRAIPRFYDAETGALTPWVVPGLDGADPLGCSPWRDGSGQHHLAVFCRPLAASPSAPHLGEFALIHCTYPEGRVLARVVIEGMPPGRVCWAPDRSDRLLFAGTDGQLYSFDFPDAEKVGMPTPRPRLISWKCDPPGRHGVHLAGPCWPDAPALGGRILLSLTAWDNATQVERPHNLWWLQLDPDGAEIVAAGRAIDTGGDGQASGWESERLPAVGATRDGRLLLAYLARVRGQEYWELWVTPITADGADRTPSALSPGCKLAEGCLSLAPAFSPDGRWVYAARRDARDGIRIARFAVVLPAANPSGDSIGE
jgi:hypothetical protein